MVFAPQCFHSIGFFGTGVFGIRKYTISTYTHRIYLTWPRDFHSFLSPKLKTKNEIVRNAIKKFETTSLEKSRKRFQWWSFGNHHRTKAKGQSFGGDPFKNRMLYCYDLQYILSVYFYNKPRV